MPQAQAPATLPADFFSKLPPETLPANFDFSGTPTATAKPPERGAVTRFLEHATGLPIGDILDNPGKYVNVFGHEYWDAAKANANQPVTPTNGPGGRLAKDISEHGFLSAETLGDLAPVAGTIATMGRFKAAPEVIPPRALAAGPIEMPGEVEASAPAFSNTTRAVRKSLLLPETAGGKIPLPESTATNEIQAPSEQPGYPSDIQKRPTDRAEIIDDKAVREQMEHDMGMQLYRAKHEMGSEAAPVPKWKLAAQAKADAIRAKAEADAQQVLADAEKAATTSKTLTKAASPKAKAAAAEPTAIPDLNDPDVLMGLLKRSLSDLK